jgi:hypothetical protein
MEEAFLFYPAGPVRKIAARYPEIVQDSASLSASRKIPANCAETSSRYFHVLILAKFQVRQNSLEPVAHFRDV